MNHRGNNEGKNDIYRNKDYCNNSCVFESYPEVFSKNWIEEQSGEILEPHPWTMEKPFADLILFESKDNRSDYGDNNKQRE